MVQVPIEMLFELKEKGMTDKSISEYLNSQGIKISAGTVYIKLDKYYKSIGKRKPKGKSIIDDELEEMKEQRKSDREIAEYFTQSGRKICLSSVHNRLKKHYKSKNKIKPRARRESILIKEDIKNEEIIELRNQGMTLREIANYFAALGKNISHTAIGMRLRRIPKEQDIQSLEQENKDEKQEDNGFRNRIKVDFVPVVDEVATKNGENDAKLDMER